MIFTFDRELRFLYANQAVLNLYGKKSVGLIGKNFFDLDVAENLSVPLRQHLQKVFDNGKSSKGETQFPDAAGETGFYEYIFNPVSQITEVRTTNYLC